MTYFKYSPQEDSGAGQPDMEARLWDYIDGNSSAEERGFVEKLIESNQQWKLRYQELLDVNQLLAGSLELDAPSLRFTKNVMEEISKYTIAPATKSYIDKKIIWGIAIFFFTMIFGFLVYMLGQIDWSAATGSEKIIPQNLKNIEWSKYFNNTYTNIFLMVNTILGLMLLDMYLGKKKKQLNQRHSG
ncbi:MAG: hypothetical protein H7Y31_18245 [Chitinophagaceae bacterium]|nr:hypothetical protein [Chitinophagaceae bacterium]